MTAKQYLSRAYGLRRRIEAKQAHLEELRAQAERITPSLSGIPHGSDVSSPTERYAVLIADLSWEIELDALDLIAFQSEIRQTIESLEDPVIVQLLSYRYLAYKNWREISELMHYSLRHVTRLHARGLHLVGDVLECP